MEMQQGGGGSGCRSRYSGLASDCTTERNRGSMSVTGKKFLLPRDPYRLWGPFSLVLNGHQDLLPLSVKRPERETDHSSHLELRLRIHGAITAFHKQLYL